MIKMFSDDAVIMKSSVHGSVLKNPATNTFQPNACWCFTMTKLFTFSHHHTTEMHTRTMIVSIVRTHVNKNEIFCSLY